MKSIQTSSTLEAVDTLVHRLHHRALQQPEEVVYTFLTYSEAGNDSITYKELDLRAQAISTYLHKQGATGKPVLLLFPPGLEYITAYFGCLYAGAIAIPAYIPHSARGLPRIQSIIDDAQAAFVLTTAETQSKLMRWIDQVPSLLQLNWIATDTLAPLGEDVWWNQNLDAHALAFLQYTSGSTAAPKGVMVTHGNLMHNLSMLQTCFRLTEISDPVEVSWLPIFHDMGLILGILMPVYTGYPVYLMAPTSFLQRPLRWLQAISDYRGNISSAPNFAFELCMRRIAEKDLDKLDLSCWISAGNGAEPIRASTLRHFSSYFAPCGLSQTLFIAAYGMAEATLAVTSRNAGEPPLILNVNKNRLEQNILEVTNEQEQNALQLVSCGRAASDQHLVIVDPSTFRPCSANEIGEIWVSGPSITQGYWNRPEATEEIFNAHTSTGEGPFLRTGDLGVLQQDNLFMTGRLKDLIIISGRNLYPQDIELTTELAHPAIRPDGCIAFSIDEGKQESLIVLAEIDHHYRSANTETTASASDYLSVNLQEIKKKVQEAIFEQHGIKAEKIVLLKIGGVLKTSSGKPQRRRCRQAFLQGELKTWNENGV
jgi:acyl-CoA synthetase (AMP-forming)/AMP-acid ligase II